MFSLQQNQRTRGQNRFCPEVGVEWGKEAAQMYTHVRKCKNDLKKKSKRTRGMTKVVEFLARKPRATSSIPSTCNHKK
jgi:hypothetical protein